MELIDRKVFHQKLIDRVKEYEGCKPPEFSESYAFWLAEQDMIYSIIDMLEEELTIDAVPAVHGHWIEEPLKKYPEQYIPVCSVCEWKAFGKYNYCPHCGARMDGDEG